MPHSTDWPFGPVMALILFLGWSCSGIPSNVENNCFPFPFLPSPSITSNLTPINPGRGLKSSPAGQATAWKTNAFRCILRLNLCIRKKQFWSTLMTCHNQNKRLQDSLICYRHISMSASWLQHWPKFLVTLLGTVAPTAPPYQERHCGKGQLTLEFVTSSDSNSDQSCRHILAYNLFWQLQSETLKFRYHAYNNKLMV